MALAKCYSKNHRPRLPRNACAARPNSACLAGVQSCPVIIRRPAQAGDVMPSQQDSDYEREFADLQHEMNAEAASWNVFVRTRLIMWFIRWVIGFVIIGVICYFRPDWSWLWWTGIAVALLSLAFQLTMNAIMQRKLRQTRKTLARAGALIGDGDN